MEDIEFSVLSVLNGQSIVKTELTQQQIQNIIFLTKDVCIDDLIPSLHERYAIAILLCRIEEITTAQLDSIISRIVDGIQVVKGINWFKPDDEDISNSTIRIQFILNTEHYLLFLSNLLNLRKTQVSETAIQSIIQSLSSFSLSNTPWCSPETYNFQTQIIRSLSTRTANNISKSLYQISQNITQSFKILKKTNTKVSKAGYKNFYPQKATRLKGLNPTLGFTNGSEPRHEWHINEISSISQLNFLIVHEFLVDLKGKYWGLIIPSILNIIDDYDMKIKVLGVRLLSTLLKKFQSKEEEKQMDSSPLDFQLSPFLKQTGLYTVFMDSILAMLSYFPSINNGISSEASSEVLRYSYEVCFQLISSFNDEKVVSLEVMKVLNSNIFHSLMFVKDDILILETLIYQMELIVERLAILTLRCLPRLLFTLGNIISDPFLTSRNAPGVVIGTLKVIKLIELNCWIRLDSHKFDILGMLIMIYQREEDAKEEGEKENYKNKKNTEILSQIHVCLKLLMNCVNDSNAMKSNLALLTKSKQNLKGLFKEFLV